MPNATPPIGYEVKFQRVGVGGGADLQIRSLLDKQQDLSAYRGRLLHYKRG